MEFFEPCSTMPAWQAWLLLVAIVMILFLISFLFNEVVLPLHYHVYYHHFIVRYSLYDMWITNANCLYWFNLS
jgi:hypothetical protein